MATFDGTWKRKAKRWADQKEDVRRLRSEQTPAEKALWAQLRAHRFQGYKFRRQHPIGVFSADFCCAAKRLVIEVDGPIHNGREEEDANRQTILEERDYRVIRFTNDEVLKTMPIVLSRIEAALMVEPTSPSPNSWGGGRGERFGVRSPVSQAKPLYLVTGAAGFIGARFVESCAQRGIDVVSVDKPSYFRERTEHAGVPFGTIVDRDVLFDWLATDRRAGMLTAVVHMGACSRTTELNREFLLRNNVRYSQRLWEFARVAGIPMIYASSAATYGGGEQGYDDDETAMDRLKPLNPYGESKWLFDQWALLEDAAGRRPAGWAGFKFFNVYGLGERHKVGMSSVILQGFEQIQATGILRLFDSHKPGVANGHQQRDFIWVGDVVRVLHFAVERALRDPTTRGVYNLGTGESRTFEALAKAVFAALGRPADIRFIPMPEVLRERYQYFTEAKMERLRALGYTEAFTSLEQGVANYVKQLAQQMPATPPRAG